MRLFVALNLPAELRARVAADVIGPLRAQLPDVRWVREEALHVTLLFLGERSEAEASEVRAVVPEVAAAHQPLTVSLGGLSMFPTVTGLARTPRGVHRGPARPRVVWLGLEDPAPVLALHRALLREHARLGVPLENRTYRPHITLGRVPARAEMDMHKALVTALATVRFQAPVTFNSLDLMRSDLTPQGTLYTALLVAPLGCR